MTTYRPFIGRCGLLAACLLAVPASAPAHHSFSAFNRAESAKRTITGTVTEFSLVNPHGWLKISVQDASDKKANWSFEMASATQLLQRGWAKDRIKYGDKVTISYFPLRFGSYGGQLISVTAAGGQVLNGLSEADRGYPKP